MPFFLRTSFLFTIFAANNNHFLQPKNNISLMKKIYSALLFAALFSTGAMAQNESELITQPAAGKTVNLYRTTTGYESVY